MLCFAAIKLQHGKYKFNWPIKLPYFLDKSFTCIWVLLGNVIAEGGWAVFVDEPVAIPPTLGDNGNCWLELGVGSGRPLKLGWSFWGDVEFFSISPGGEEEGDLFSPPEFIWLRKK